MSQSADSQHSLVVTFDLQQADIEHGLAALPRARAARVMAWVSMVAVVALVAWRVREGRDPAVMVVVGLFLLGVLFLGRNPSRRIAKRIFEALPAESRHVEMAFDETGVVVGTGGETTPTPWTRFIRTLDAKKSVLLFESRSNAQIIPKRALSAEQYAELTRLVRAHVVTQREPWLTPELTRRLFIYALLLAAILFYYHFQQK